MLLGCWASPDGQMAGWAALACRPNVLSMHACRKLPPRASNARCFHPAHTGIASLKTWRAWLGPLSVRQACCCHSTSAAATLLGAQQGRRAEVERCPAAIRVLHGWPRQMQATCSWACQTSLPTRLPASSCLIGTPCQVRAGPGGFWGHAFSACQPPACRGCRHRQPRAHAGCPFAGWCAFVLVALVVVGFAWAFQEPTDENEHLVKVGLSQPVWSRGTEKRLIVPHN